MGYEDIPHLRWLNEHYTEEFLPNNEWVLVNGQGLLGHSPILDDLLTDFGFIQSLTNQIFLVFISLTKEDIPLPNWLLNEGPH